MVQDGTGLWACEVFVATCFTTMALLDCSLCYKYVTIRNRV